MVHESVGPLRYSTLKWVMGQPPSVHWLRYSVAWELLVVTNWNCGGAWGGRPLVRATSVRDGSLRPAQNNHTYIIDESDVNMRKQTRGSLNKNSATHPHNYGQWRRSGVVNRNAGSEPWRFCRHHQPLTSPTVHSPAYWWGHGNLHQQILFRTTSDAVIVFEYHVLCKHIKKRRVVVGSALGFPCRVQA